MSVRQTIKRYTKTILILKRKTINYTEIQGEISVDPDGIDLKLLNFQ